MFRFDLKYAPLKFKRPSGTSRGILTEKQAWYVTLSSSESEIHGTGEISIIPGLTKEFDTLESYNNWLETCIYELNSAELNEKNYLEFIDIWADKPSLFFGLETAYYDFIAGGKQLFFDTPFTRKETGIPVNGLIWMGDEIYMKEQISEKLQEGYSCIKMKIGAIDFETEIKLLKVIRENYPKDQITLRVDANGAFSLSEAPEKLKQLADLEIHSIEQPVKAGDWEGMYLLCKSTPCPIALDEELIGIYDWASKKELLTTIQPQYIILKPSLHGGIKGCQEWINLAASLSIPWWITSALESNVGLNAITQFVSNYEPVLHQGLGTGSLYVENTAPTTVIRNGKMFFTGIDAEDR